VLNQTYSASYAYFALAFQFCQTTKKGLAIKIEE
jgi:hypothetical protein